MACCPIGERNDVVEIDAALRRCGEDGAETLSAIAERLEVAKSSLWQHRAKCLGLPQLLSRKTAIERAGAEVTDGIAKRLGLNDPGDDPATAPRKIERADVERRAVELRVAGKTYEAIADELGVSADAAADAVERVLLRTRDRANKSAEAARALEVARCDAIISSFWERATDSKADEGDRVAIGRGGDDDDPRYEARFFDRQGKAADRLLKAMERRAKLLGLDAPTGAAVQINVVQSPEFSKLITAILGALVPFPEARVAVINAVRAERERTKQKR